ncbi:MAG: acetyl-CoA C-acetyltransferase [Candidatus Hydrogenedentes bacterium]|nr:acetyl-CoA C-acetyltransferase [Candidatus Hydrogenedentota bacterium]MDK1021588.1 acetyl-CoA C-acetyltransferase [Candidatus Hydrogenedentota bacterium]
MRNVLLLGAVRTPIGSMSGAFATTSAVELGIVAAEGTFDRTGVDPKHVEEVIFGNALQAGLGQNPARQIAMGVDVPVGVPSFTVNKVCGSGMKAVELGWQSILLERANIILAGGTENMTQAPYLLPSMRGGARLGDAQAVDSMVHDGLTDVFNQYHMGITAENVAEKFGISREEQDAFAVSSQEKCAKAVENRRFKSEIVPVTVKQRKGELVIDADEYPKPGTTLETLGRLRPAFKQDGTVTAANASGINDGAASMLLMAEDALTESLSTTNVVYLRDLRSSGCDPATMGLGPIGVVRKLMANNGLTIDDIGLWELNEAFASQSIAVVRELGIDIEKVNVNGGAIALGHPIGCSGARIVVTLIHEMKRRDVRYGVAAMCIGGGQGIGCLLENKN